MKAIDDIRVDRGEVTTDGTGVHVTGPRKWQAKSGNSSGDGLGFDKAQGTAT